MYLSSIQQGIQAAHCVAEMLMKPFSEQRYQIQDWALNHKTLVCLNGGNNASLTDLYNQLVGNPKYPVAKFHEDEQSMDSMLTCVGIIVPEEIYGIDLLDPTTWGNLEPWEIELATKLKKMPLAR